MKRIDIRYGGDQYSVGGRDLSDVKAEVERGLAAGGPFWMVVNDGEGFRRDAHLLVSPGMALSIIPIPDPDDPDSPDTHN